MRLIQAWLFAATIIAVSCGKNAVEQQNEAQTADQKIVDGNIEIADSTVTGTPYQQGTPPPKTGTTSVMKTDFDKKIVKSGQLNIETKDFKSFTKKLSDKIKAHGGYISSEVQNSNDYKMESEVVIRVPVDQFDATMQDLVNDAETLHEKKITAEDQTREFIDSRSRLEAKKQIRLRYLELLKQAKNMSEIIEVQSEINSIQEEIEVVSGRINQINQTAAMSTISLTYYQVLNPSAIDDKGDGFFERVLDGFVKGCKWVGELFVGLITIWPLLLFMTIGGYFLRKKLSTKPA
jgi:hypothetical protein